MYRSRLANEQRSRVHVEAAKQQRNNSEADGNKIPAKALEEVSQ
jgi:hypothetical protein